jgi:alpha-ketoglutarate-dependent taurine dioxygenase
MTPVIRPLSHVIGAEVTGIDVARPLSRDVHRQLEEAFDTFKLLCFRDQMLTTDSLVAFARSWGPVAEQTMSGLPGGETAHVSIASNADENGRPNGRRPDPASMRWHTGRSWRRDLVTATLLYGLEVPSEGGDTLFANTAMAYEALLPCSRETGGGSLLDDLIEFATRPEFVYRHKWRPRDLLMWDDRCTLHCDTPYDPARELRTMFRTVVASVPAHRTSQITA